MPKFAIPLVKNTVDIVTVAFNGGVRPADEMITPDAQYWYVYDSDPEVPGEIVEYWSLTGKLGRVDFLEIHELREITEL